MCAQSRNRHCPRPGLMAGASETAGHDGLHKERYAYNQLPRAYTNGFSSPICPFPADKRVGGQL